MVFRALSRENVSIPALVVAGILCAIFSKGGPLLLFFLIPLAFVCFRYNPVTAWAAFAFASGLSLIMTLAGMASMKIPASMVMLDFVFFVAVTGVFTWINAPSIFGVSVHGKKIPGVTRFIAGSVLTALIFMLVIIQKLGDQFILEELNAQLAGAASVYRSSDVVQNAMLDSLTPEFLIELSKAVLLRGGALAAIFFIFWMSRQAGILLTRFTRKPYRQGQLINFRTDARLIWVFSASLILVLLFRFLTSPPLEIVVWNILTLCVILYFAQGIGILQYFISRPAVPLFLRFLLPLAFVFLIFSPGLNALVLGAVILLGIAENWVFFRKLSPNGPPSTPEA